MEMVMMDGLINYGMAGLFIAYLIFDRQVLLKRITKSLDNNTEAIKMLTRRLRR